jgi:hypothetical protein
LVSIFCGFEKCCILNNSFVETIKVYFFKSNCTPDLVQHHNELNHIEEQSECMKAASVWVYSMFRINIKCPLSKVSAASVTSSLEWAHIEMSDYFLCKKVLLIL